MFDDPAEPAGAGPDPVHTQTSWQKIGFQPFMTESEKRKGTAFVYVCSSLLFYFNLNRYAYNKGNCSVFIQGMGLNMQPVQSIS